MSDYDIGTPTIVIIITAIVGWAVIESAILIVRFLLNHMEWVS